MAKIMRLLDVALIAIPLNKTRACAWSSFALLVAIIAITNLSAGTFASASAPLKSQDMIKLEYFLKLPARATGLAWSNDSKKVAFDRSDPDVWRPHLAILDVARRSIGPAVYTERGGGQLAISPDDQSVALLSGELLLVDPTTGHTKARFSFGDKCLGAHDPSMSFSRDGRHIWLTCQSYGPGAVAVKLALPDLRIEEIIPPPNDFPIIWEKNGVAGAGSPADFVAPLVNFAAKSQIRDGVIFYVGRVFDRSLDRTDPAERTAAIIGRGFAASAGLESNVIILPFIELASFEINTGATHSETNAGLPVFGSRHREIRYQHLSTDQRTHIVEIATYNTEPISLVVSIDVQTKRILSTIEVQSGQSKTRVALVPETDLFLSAVRKTDHSGTLSAWNHRTGQLVAQISCGGLLHMAVSPDGKYLVASDYEGLYIYSLGALIAK
jgi:hypothetical protein